MRSKDPEIDILDKIDRIQQRYPALIRPGLEVHEEYGISRSFRRDSNLDAHNRGVIDGDIDRNNRLRKVERVEARKAKLRMRDHYIDVLVSLESFLKYSQVL